MMSDRNSERDCWTADGTGLDDTGPEHDDDPNIVSWSDFKRKKNMIVIKILYLMN